jgi:hypothetical protein
MSRQTEAIVSCNILSVSVTCEHANVALSSTGLQSIGGGRRLGEPGRSNQDTPEPTAPKDSGAGVASLRAALAEALMPMPRVTQSRSKPLASSPGRGLVPSTSMLTVPGDVPSALGAFNTSGTDSFGAGVHHGTDATKGKYGGDTRRVAGRWMIVADEV